MAEVGRGPLPAGGSQPETQKKHEGGGRSLHETDSQFTLSNKRDLCGACEAGYFVTMYSTDR